MAGLSAGAPAAPPPGRVRARRAAHGSLLLLLASAVAAKLRVALPPGARAPAPPAARPLAVVDVHASAATAGRASALYGPLLRDHPLVRDGTFAVRLLGPGAHPAHCSDARDGDAGLVCRVDAAYSRFLAEFPGCPWLFRALDDTAVRLGRLRAYLRRLPAGDPAAAVVFRAHANVERDVRAYAHGGAGWLASRGYAALHAARNLSLAALARRARYGQDDTAQTAVLDRLYRKPAQWDEPLLVGFRCANCNASRFPRCPPWRRCARLADVVALHTFGASPGGRRLLALADAAPPELLFFRDNAAQAVRLCVRRGAFRVYSPHERGIAPGNASV
jgi:hypothetical protein